MPSCTRRFVIDAGHRVLGHQGKCRHLHGHRYEIEVTVSSRGLDALGMVVDFSVIKDKVGKWLDDNLDHNLILHPDDPLLQDPGNAEVFAGRSPFVMPHGKNPTAENLAFLVYKQAGELLRPDGLWIDHVRVYETENCWADFSPKR